MKKVITACVMLAICAFGISFVRADIYDETEWWIVAGSASVGKTFLFTMPEEGDVYYKLSGVSSGNAYTFTASEGDYDIEVVYTYKCVDKYTGGSDTYINSATIGGLDGEESSKTWFITNDSWDYDIVEDPYSETGAMVKPQAYYIHIYGTPGETVSVTSSKGIVTPPKSGTLTVYIKGADATWSLKGQSESYTNGQSISILGQQTVVFPKVGKFIKPADRTVTPLTDGETNKVVGVYGFALTLKGTDVTAEYDGDDYSGSLTVVAGDEVILRAQESYEANNVGYVFQSWKPSKSYDFGADYSAASAETTIVMPAENLTMTATYLKSTEVAYMTMYATWESVVIGETTIDPADGDLLWSTDGKTWYPTGTKTLVKKGSYTVQWKSASGAWVGPSKSKVTLAAGDDYSNSDSPAQFTFATVLKPMAVVYKGGEWSESSEGGTVTMKPADGVVAKDGTTITLTAKANKGYAFVGWQFEDDYGETGELSTTGTASRKLLLKAEELHGYLDAQDHTAHYHAVFRPTSDYKKADVAKVFESVTIGDRSFEPTYDEEGFSGAVEVKIGLNCVASIRLGCASRAKPMTYKVSGTLPRGLKFDAANECLTGTPTASGTYSVTLTATDPAGNSCELALTIVVKSVFSPVVGNWRALLMDEDSIYAGLFEMSITENGKASCKIITASGTTSLSPTVTWTEDSEDPDGDGSFSISYAKETGNAKSGSLVSLTVVSGDPFCVSYQSKVWKNSETTSEVSLSGCPCRADSKWYGDNDFVAKFLGKYYTVSLTAEDYDAVYGYRTPTELMAPGYLTLTTDKKGTVKVAGKLADGEKISASALLLPSTNGTSASALVFVAPSGYKKKGSVALQLDFDSSGNVVSSVGAWVTPPLMDAIDGEEEDFFLSGILSLSARGVIYSKIDDLTEYYLSISVSAGESAPTLEYSYTDEEKTKVYDEALLAVDGYELDSDQLTGGTGGKITIQKSPVPWKDSYGEWHYDETKEDAQGETQPITNPGSLTISFKPATGIFSGKFNLFFDYEVPQYKGGEEVDPKLEHKSVSCAYEGVLVKSDDDSSKMSALASAVYSGKYTYVYTTAAGKAATKTYTKKTALTVNWSLDNE